MINAEIRKGKGIEELLSRYGEQAQVTNAVTRPQDSPLEQVLQRYEAMLDSNIVSFKLPYEQFTEILTPAEIKGLAMMACRYNAHKKHKPVFGRVLNGLIQNSYDNGHNNFQLDLGESPGLFNLGSELCGKEGDILEIEIDGDVGLGSLNETKYVRATVKGAIGAHSCQKAYRSEFSIAGNACEETGDDAVESIFNIGGSVDGGIDKGPGTRAIKSRFHFSGNVHGTLGTIAKDSQFTVEGTAYQCCGNGAQDCTFDLANFSNDTLGTCSTRSTYIIRGILESPNTSDMKGKLVSLDIYEAKGCTLKAVEQRAVRRLSRYVPEGNRVIQIMEDGTEKVIRDYANFRH